MTRRGILTLSALALLSAVGLAKQAGQTPSGLRSVVAGEWAYLLGPAEQAVGPGVRWVMSAPGGRYLLCERRKLPTVLVPGVTMPPTEVSLTAWDTKTRKSSTLWRFTESEELRVSTSPHAWFGGTSTALLTIDEGEKRSLALLNLGAGTLQRLPMANGFFSGIVEHPDLPLLAFTTVEINAEGMGSPRITLIRSSGAIIATVPLIGGKSPQGWSQDGKRLYLTVVERVPNQKPRLAWYGMDLTGKETRLEKEPTDIARQEPKQLPLKIVEQSATLTTGTSTEKLPSLWLGDQQKPGARITAEVDPRSSVLLPDLSAVAYQYQSALYVVPLITLDKTAYEDLLKRQKRAQLLSNSKQIGLAIMMYAQDYDETFPSGGLSDTIMPYLKNSDILNGFQFTYSGPLELGKIEKPADTVLGFISGPGGRAVLYADGHARWEDS